MLDIEGKAIGVAVADNPLGPFKDARGSALITNDMTKAATIRWDDIDPAVYIEFPEKTAYAMGRSMECPWEYKRPGTRCR